MLALAGDPTARVSFPQATLEAPRGSHSDVHLWNAEPRLRLKVGLGCGRVARRSGRRRPQAIRRELSRLMAPHAGWKATSTLSDIGHLSRSGLPGGRVRPFARALTRGSDSVQARHRNRDSPVHVDVVVLGSAAPGGSLPTPLSDIGQASTAVWTAPSAGGGGNRRTVDRRAPRSTGGHEEDRRAMSSRAGVLSEDAGGGRSGSTPVNRRCPSCRRS